MLESDEQFKSVLLIPMTHQTTCRTLILWSPAGSTSPGDQLREDMKTIFHSFSQFYFTQCCTCLLIDRCLKMKTSRYYLSVFPSGILLLLKYCVSSYEILNGIMLCCWLNATVHVLIWLLQSHVIWLQGAWHWCTSFGYFFLSSF